MKRWCVACAAMAWLGGCDSQIVLGDREERLPTTSPSGGTAGSSGSPSASGGTAGGSSSGSSGSAGSEPSAGGNPDGPIPDPGEVVWETDHEVGDFSDWERGGEFYGGEYEWGHVNGYVDIGIGRDGSNGVVADIDTAARGETSGGVRMYRRIEGSAAYYSAWFRLEEAHSVVDWWSIFLFHARDDSLSLDNDVSLWDVRIVEAPEGGLALQFFDHDVMLGTLAANAGRIAPGRWFELSAYLDYRPPNATRLRIALNGEPLFDMKSLHTEPQRNVFWSVGNGAGHLDPADSTLYIDDCAIHTTAP